MGAGIYKEFKSNVLDFVTGHIHPAIKLDKEIPRAVICKVFESADTGGVSPTVFELVNTSLATYDFDLRGNWDNVVRLRVWDEGLEIAINVTRGFDVNGFLTSMLIVLSSCSMRSSELWESRTEQGF